MHRQIMQAPAGLDVDHINGDRLDNQRGNLRIATRQQNCWNTTKRKGNYTSPYKGVSWRRGQWAAYITVSNRQRPLGKFADPIEAARAYDCAAREMFGEFAYLNFPETA
jgi:hypothetical protein